MRSEMGIFVNRKITPRDAIKEGLKIEPCGTGSYRLQGKFMSMTYPDSLCEVRKNSIGQEFTALKYYDSRQHAEEALQAAGVPEIK